MRAALFICSFRNASFFASAHDLYLMPSAYRGFSSRGGRFRSTTATLFHRPPAGIFRSAEEYQTSCERDRTQLRVFVLDGTTGAVAT
jgi:hypothetical protein